MPRGLIGERLRSCITPILTVLIQWFGAITQTELRVVGRRLAGMDSVRRHALLQLFGPVEDDMDLGRPRVGIGFHHCEGAIRKNVEPLQTRFERTREQHLRRSARNLPPLVSTATAIIVVPFS